MSITSGGSLGSARDINTGISLIQVTTTAVAEVGKEVFVAVSRGNSQTTDGQTTDVSSITDSAAGGSNTWEKVHEYTNGNGNANAGTVISVWKSHR